MGEFVAGNLIAIVMVYCSVPSASSRFQTENGGKADS